MADRKWSELSGTTPQDDDGVALQRGSQNFRWTFSGLKTFLDGFFATDAALSAHTSAANPHSDSASDADVTAAVAAHDGDPGAHPGTFAPASHVGAGGAAQHQTATTGAGGEGFAPALSGSATTYLDGTGAWSTPPGSGASPTINAGDMIFSTGGGAGNDVRLPIGAPAQKLVVNAGATAPEWVTDAGTGVTNPPSAKGDLWTFHTANTQRLPVDVDGLVLRTNSATTAGIEWAEEVASPVGGSSLRYTFDTNTTNSPAVALGNVRVNNADYSLATEMYASNTSRNGATVDPPWSSMKSGDYVSLYDERKGDLGGWFVLTGDPVPTGAPDWWTIAISAITGITSGIANGRDVVVGLAVNPNRFVPAVASADGDLIPFDGSAYYKLGVGADGQVLTARPGAAAQSKLAWETPGSGGNVNAAADLASGEIVVGQGSKDVATTGVDVSVVAVTNADNNFTAPQTISGAADGTLALRDEGATANFEQFSLVSDGGAFSIDAPFLTGQQAYLRLGTPSSGDPVEGGLAVGLGATIGPAGSVVATAGFIDGTQTVFSERRGGTMDNNVGIAGQSRALASNYSGAGPEPTGGHYYTASGTTLTINALQAEVGVTTIYVPSGITASVSAYSESNSQPSGAAHLILDRASAAAFGTATWTGAA